MYFGWYLGVFQMGFSESGPSKSGPSESGPSEFSEIWVFENLDFRRSGCSEVWLFANQAVLDEAPLIGARLKQALLIETAKPWGALPIPTATI